jgi:hypothetical protein
MQAARDAARDGALDGARRAIEQLAREAERAGVVVAIASPRRYVDLPTAREVGGLIAELAGAPVAPLLDVAAAHLVDAMGFQPLDATVAAFGAGPLAYVGDACGPVGALAPGRGQVELAKIAAALPAEAAVAFSPWAGLTVDEALEGPRLVRALF